MADAPTLSPEASRSDSALGRTLVAAARSCRLYLEAQAVTPADPEAAGIDSLPYM